MKVSGKRESARLFFMTKDDPTDFPGWPETLLPPRSDTDSAGAGAIQYLHRTARGPDPQDVIRFKCDNNASVREAALRFGLSRAQIVKVCGTS
jgi:hypothetical protein